MCMLSCQVNNTLHVIANYGFHASPIKLYIYMFGGPFVVPCLNTFMI